MVPMDGCDNDECVRTRGFDDSERAQARRPDNGERTDLTAARMRGRDDDKHGRTSGPDDSDRTDPMAVAAAAAVGGGKWFLYGRSGPGQ